MDEKMVNQYDLYDITTAFVNIRNKIEDKTNCKILNEIIFVLKIDSNNFEDNQIRKAIASIKDLDK